MIEEKIVADKIEILENGIIQVRVRSDVLRDGLVIASSFTRKVLYPGDDFSQEGDKVKSICSIVHTPSVINSYEESVKHEGNPVIENLASEE